VQPRRQATPRWSSFQPDPESAPRAALAEAAV
jgi:hypothetical protein